MVQNALIPAEEALSIVLESATALPAVDTPLTQCADRVLGEDIEALRTQPPFNASAMDGYAVRQNDINELPATLKVVGTSRAGMPFNGQAQPGEAVRIFTGAVVPDGLDSIVIQENTKRINDDEVSVIERVQKGKFIRPAGLDFTLGDTLLIAGETVSPASIALAASMNHSTLPVIAKPRVALIATGDELVLPGDTLSEGQVIASNTFGLVAAIEKRQAEVIDLGIIPDNADELSSGFENAMNQGADIIVTTGGASVGDHDLILPVAQSLGFEILITKIAMRPGKPFIFGKLKRNDKTVYLTGLAGNPVSSLVAFSVFVAPLIDVLSGQPHRTENRQTAQLGRDLPANDERAEYMRGSLSQTQTGDLIATPFEKQDSSILTNLVKANCLIYRPVQAPAAQAGEKCEIIPL